jgi:hypothetical protein
MQIKPMHREITYGEWYFDGEASEMVGCQEDEMLVVWSV